MNDSSEGSGNGPEGLPTHPSAATETPYDGLTPECVIEAVESLGLLSDLRIYPLNSYENRVYQVGIDEQPPLIAKFYRPGRWSDAQILEEHDFSLALQALEVPVVPPMRFDDQTLLSYQGFRFSLYERRAGRAPELDNDDNLYVLGQNIARIHALGQTQTFEHRNALTVERFGIESRTFLLEHGMLPASLEPAYATLTRDLLALIGEQFDRVEYHPIRLHGDCHPGNILWRNDRPNFVDLDDACNGPAIQDLWMCLSGERDRRLQQIEALMSGYEEFCDFDNGELPLIEPLRTLRLMHYAAWLGRRWSDPAFPKHFPWFNTERYWSEHILELREQFSALQEPALRRRSFNS